MSARPDESNGQTVTESRETTAANRENKNGAPSDLADRWTTAVGKLAPQLRENQSLLEFQNGSSPWQCATLAGVTPEIQLQALAKTLNIPMETSLAGRAPSAQFVARIPIGFARQHAVLGLAGDDAADNRLQVALGELNSWSVLDVIARYLQCSVEPVLAPAEQVLSAINVAYQQQSGQTEQVIESLEKREVLDEIEGLVGREDLLDVSGRAPVIKLVNMLLLEAVKSRASDVHVQPYEDRLVIRMRIDGVLFDSFTLPKDLQEEIISRIKVVGRMDIAEKRLPQDGRATVQVGDRIVDLRIASLPTSFGERIVIRLLDKSARVYSLSELGMQADTMDQFRQLIGLEHGLILVTGPTGSGKSTTLYAALQEMNATDRNIVTLEDPIEYQLEGISQTQVSDKKGMTFASGLRSVLRQDPDIIMVGEIRDEETAVMAIQSALTGHLVFSTLHTNDSASAITRLLDLGIEQYLVSSSVIGVLAQRLVRQVCPKCSSPYTPTAEELRPLGITPAALDDGAPRRGAGCDACRQTGCTGRIGIFELFVVSDAVRKKIQTHANASEIREVALSDGMRLLGDDGLDKIRSGVTTVGEVARVTMRTKL